MRSIGRMQVDFNQCTLNCCVDVKETGKCEVRHEENEMRNANFAMREGEEEKKRGEEEEEKEERKEDAHLHQGSRLCHSAFS